MVAAPRTIRIEVFRLDTAFLKILARRAAGLNRTSGRDMVCGHAMPQRGQYARAFDVLHRSGMERHVVKIRSTLDVSRDGVPVIGFALRNSQAFPPFITFKDR